MTTVNIRRATEKTTGTLNLQPALMNIMLKKVRNFLLLLKRLERLEKREMDHALITYLS